MVLDELLLQNNITYNLIIIALNLKFCKFLLKQNRILLFCQFILIITLKQIYIQRRDDSFLEYSFTIHIFRIKHLEMLLAFS